ncbi:hypothetical protein TUMSATVNIG1_61070 (plasmid) [Vibrio nigripulchritudo]|uniref:hypothetical protein n=1 Tax=Vibrio nigripulchritudo TaxID=28173 RepID=UPI00190A4044|nr:hypothetical protein [Vibrio nigripulchritudo]BCL74123.1 hypothetical protein VNTUMSATTG_60600 [Vibrio nigripulchritudo]BDU35498.1 hypothetical protein TUMSATVNIG1_61070 [Vibrio nigripulchritudo]
MTKGKCDAGKKKLVEDFISGCVKQGLTHEESVDLAARSLIGAVNAAGKSYAKIEIEGMGVIEVEC